MKHSPGHVVRSLFAVLLLVLICCRSASANDVVCDNNGCVNLNTFLANIASILDQKVAGYVIIVGNLPPVSGGRAIRHVDAPPDLDMSPDLTMNIASVSKTLTAVAILQLLTKNGLTPDAKIWPYLYYDWRLKAGPNINQITFKELLTHKSGFGQLESACANGNTYAALKSLVIGGVQPGNIGAAQYGNCNFALLRELMPALTGQSVGLTDRLRAQNSMNIYINYMNQYVFKPVGIPPSSCRPPPPHAMQILSYPFTPAKTPGYNWGDETADMDGLDTCGPGGWNLTANDVFKVVNDLANGNVLLTNNDKQQMISDYLGWDNAVGRDCPGPNLCKNGDYRDFGPGKGNTVWAYAGIFKSQIPVVVFVNSPLPSPYQPYNPVDGTPGTCTAKGQSSQGPNACCTGKGTGNCLSCQKAKCGDIIDLVADAYATPCAGISAGCWGNGNCCSSQCTGGKCDCLSLGGSCRYPGVCCGFLSVCSSQGREVPPLGVVTGTCTAYQPPQACNGRPVPKSHCSAQWRCCGDDGWMCGLCR
jgi:Beta-lactamase